MITENLSGHKRRAGISKQCRKLASSLSLLAAIGWGGRWGRAALVLMCISLPPFHGLALAEDWSTYRHDARRGGVTGEQLDPARLQVDWIYSTPSLPVQAWPGPAPRDYYNSPNMDNKPQMDLDRVLHVVVAGDSVYFGSSVDDSVYCLDLETGQEKWSFVTEGPVRMAPSVDQGKVYFGSDDGSVYCLDASTGALIWSRRIAPSNYRVPSDGNFISLWPIRSGVLVDGGVAYCTAGFLPAERIYICALDALTGSSTGTGRWIVSRRNDMAPQGYLLASPIHLYVPSSRDSPYLVRRTDGALLGQFNAGSGLSGSGRGAGTYALLTEDHDFLSGPDRFNKLVDFESATAVRLATFDGNRMISTPTVSYLQTDTQIASLDRTCYNTLTGQLKALQDRKDSLKATLAALDDRDDSDECRNLNRELVDVEQGIGRVNKALPGCITWSVNTDCPYDLIRAGNHLIAGGKNKVVLLDGANGATLWNQTVDGKAYGLAAAGGRLFVSTDKGRIYSFRQTTGEPTGAYCDRDRHARRDTDSYSGTKRDFRLDLVLTWLGRTPSLQ